MTVKPPTQPCPHRNSLRTARAVYTLQLRPVKIISVHGGELVSTGKAESVMQAEAPNLVKMGKALTANNNQTAYAYAA